MSGLLNLGMVVFPAGFLLLQLQSPSSQSSAGDPWGSLREIGTFLISILLAWAVKYIRESRAEVKAAKVNLPTVQDVNSIKEEQSVMRADLLLLTDTLERTRGERDQAQTLADSATKALQRMTDLLAAERETNANWGRLSKENDDKITSLEEKVALLTASNDFVDKFATQLVDKIEQLLANRLADRAKGDTNAQA